MSAEGGKPGASVPEGAQHKRWPFDPLEPPARRAGDEARRKPRPPDSPEPDPLSTEQE